MHITTNNNPSDEASHPYYSRLDEEQSTTKPLTANPQQSESRSTTSVAPNNNLNLSRRADEASHPYYARFDKERSITKPRTTKPQQSESRLGSTTSVTPNNNPSDKASHADYSRLDKERSTTKPRTTNPQQSESRSTTSVTVAPNNNPSNEASRPNYSRLDNEQSTTKPRTTNLQQSESRSTTSVARQTRHETLDSKPLNSKRGSRENSSDIVSDVTTTTIRQRTPPPSTDRHKARSGLSNSHPEATSGGDFAGSLDPFEYRHVVPRNKDLLPSIPSSNPGRFTMNPIQLTHISKDPQHPKETTKDTSAKGSAALHHSARRPQDALAPPGHHSRDEQRDRTLENKQSMGQVSGFGRVVAAVDSLMSSTTGPPPPKDKSQQQKEEYYRMRDELRQANVTIDKYDRELKERNGELNKSNHSSYVNHLQHENQRSKDTINGLQNELNNVYQQLADAKALSDVRGKELLSSQVFSTKVDTLSISEVGEKVNALNDEIFQAAATLALGDVFIHKRHEVSQKDLDTAAAESREMVGEKITNILITQSLKPDFEVNPLLVQVVLRIFMVKFCVSKIQSWHPGESAIGEILSAIYSKIRSNEEQEVSGQRRTRTRSNDARSSSQTWKKELYEKLQSVLTIASWAPRSSEHEESYWNHFTSISEAINELRMAIGESFTSTDLHIIVFECDEIYDPAIMEDAYDDCRQSNVKRAPEAIVGTVGIGLGNFLAVKTRNILFQYLIPAKIVLRSTFKEALEPIQSIRSRKKKPVENMDGTNQDGRD